MEWNKEQLIEFIVEASLHTYTDPNAPKSAHPYRPGCEEYLYESGDWKYLDSYAWSSDGGGEELVYFKGTPVWIMNYYGYLIGEHDTRSIYAFLHEALREQHASLPIRGTSFSRGPLRYEVEYERDSIENFRGAERIYVNDSLAYEAYLHGGFVR